MKSSAHHLIYFTNGSIGDFLMALYFARLVLAAAPQTTVRIITPRSKKLFEELAKKYPVIIEECNGHSASGLLRSLLLLLRAFNKNLVVVPGGSFPASVTILARLLCLRPGSRCYRPEKFDHTKTYPHNIHEQVRELGYNLPDATVGLSLPKDASVLEKNRLKAKGYIVLHPCGSGLHRSFSVDEIAKLIDTLRSRYPQHTVVITGSAADSAHIQKAIAGKNPSNVVDLTGKATMSELASLIDNAAFYIGVDTGISHLAAMLQAPSLIVSHEASLLYWLPYYNPHARILYSIHDCPHGLTEGFDHIKSCYNEEDHYLERVPFSVILGAIETLHIV